MEIAKLLSTWGLKPDVVQAFLDDEVDLEALPLLSDAVIRKLIPKEGPRAIFEKKLNAYRSNPTFTATETSHVEPVVPQETPPATPEPGPSNQNCDVVEPPSKRRRLCRVYVNTIDKLLDGSVEGQLVLAAYKQKEILDNSSRDQLVKCIIFAQFRDDYNTRLDTAILRKLAEEIVIIFPSEALDTYFSSYKRGRKTVIAGRLMVKYHNVRRKLIAVGLIPKTTLEEELVIEEGIEFGNDIDIEEDEDLRWLSSNTRPWPDVQSAWRRTHTSRMTIIRGLEYKKAEDENDALSDIIDSVPKYLNYFKAINTPNGWELLLDDFNQIHPNLNLRIFAEWPRIIKFARSKLGSRACKFLDDDSLTEAQKTVQLLLSFNSLFKIRNVDKSKGTWRVSRLEVQRSFVLHAETDGAWKTIIHDRREVLKAQDHTLQPYLVFIGPINAIKKYKFVINDKSMWDLESPLQALDVAFKCFFATNTSYPCESRHIWTFIQQSVYGIESTDDYKCDKPLKAFLSSYKKEYLATTLDGLAM